MNNEATVLNNKVVSSLDTVILEGIKTLKERTGANIVSYRIEGDKIELLIDETRTSKESLEVLRDRLCIEDFSTSISDSPISKFKARLDTILKDDFRDYTIKFKSLDNTGDIVFIYLTVNIPTIPYPVSVSFKLYEDGFIDMGYMLFGDTEKDERWSATSIDSQRFVETLKSIKAYYLSKNELPE